VAAARGLGRLEEDTSDSEVLRPLLEDVNIEDALADDAYDANDAFEFMKSKGVDCPGIKIRENAVVGKDESARSMAVLEYKKLGYKGWKQMHQYGRRWRAVASRQGMLPARATVRSALHIPDPFAQSHIVKARSKAYASQQSDSPQSNTLLCRDSS
jgi:hypothetical protein